MKTFRSRWFALVCTGSRWFAIERDNAETLENVVSGATWASQSGQTGHRQADAGRQAGNKMLLSLERRGHELRSGVLSAFLVPLEVCFLQLATTLKRYVLRCLSVLGLRN